MSSGTANGNVMSADMISSGGSQSGQYILMQRTPGLVGADIPAPRSSSAPPAQQHQVISNNHSFCILHLTIVCHDVYL